MEIKCLLWLEYLFIGKKTNKNTLKYVEKAIKDTVLGKNVSL